MKYAIIYQTAAAEAHNKAVNAREASEANKVLGFAYDRMCNDSDYRYWSKRAYQYSKLSMMYREQGF